MVDGLIVIDKPSGPSSHDVVARMRRVLGERRVGHTGTLDPMATGVLPLVVGRATRLARFMNAGGKSYEAVVRLGVSTDTADAQGEPVGAAFSGALPSRDTIDRALDAFRGTFLQQPPAFSAKKIGGERSYKLARATHGRGRLPEATQVTAFQLNLVGFEGDLVTLALECSSGFYVRSLAHDLGQALGTGAHLAALRRTRSGNATLAGAIPLEAAEADRARARAAVLPLPAMLLELRAVALTPEGVRHALQGRDLGPRDLGLGIWDSEDKSRIPNPESLYVRMLDSAGALVGIAEPSKTPGLLHPSVVLM